MNRVVIFAGTKEGRKLSEFLSAGGVHVTMCVATDYAVQLTQPNKNLEIIAKRQDTPAIIGLLHEKQCCLVVDATHPYASAVSENIRCAVEKTQIDSIRLIRTTTQQRNNRYIYVASVQEAVNYLCEHPMKTLLTIGSKELHRFTALQNFSSNVYARVLPYTEVVKNCTDLGFIGRQLICMQGPFSRELNTAMIRDLQIECLVTKDSGNTGGYHEKILSVEETGIQMISIGRPKIEEGYTYNQAKHLLAKRFHIHEKYHESTYSKMFPVFIALANQNVLVVGGGKVAQRRITKMLSYGAKVTVLSPSLTPKLTEYVQSKRIIYRNKTYTPGQLKGFSIILAATNSREVNYKIGQEAKDLHIPVNVADSREESTFYFPALIEGKKLVAGVISTQADHSFVRKAAKKLREVWENVEETSNSREP